MSEPTFDQQTERRTWRNRTRMAWLSMIMLCLHSLLMAYFVHENPGLASGIDALRLYAWMFSGLVIGFMGLQVSESIWGPRP